MYLVSEEARLCGCSGGVVTETGSIIKQSALLWQEKAKRSKIATPNRRVVIACLYMMLTLSRCLPDVDLIGCSSEFWSCDRSPWDVINMTH